jgi:ABC-type uncharacterized transport system substrate-binding protein
VAALAAKPPGRDRQPYRGGHSGLGATAGDLPPLPHAADGKGTGNRTCRTLCFARIICGGVTMRFRYVLAMSGLVLSSPALAHPHQFIDTGVEVLFGSDGTAEALRITWTYDEMYSLLILEDRKLDPDYDGVLTPQELVALNGFDMEWDPGYQGDTYALLGETPLDLGRPQDWTVAFESGKIVSTHVRRLTSPAEVREVPLIVQSYDPSFYAAYSIIGSPVLSGTEDCSAQVFEPDLAAADTFLQQALAELNATGDVEGEFPAVGAAYSDEVRVTCAAPS